MSLELEVTPESAGWGYSCLRVLTLGPGESTEFDTGGDEVIVVPLSGAADLTVEDEAYTLTGRADVFAGPTDAPYVPPQTSVALSSAAGGRFALCGARTDGRLGVSYLPAAEVPVELRGAGQSSRQVRNFGTPARWTPPRSSPAR